MINVEKIWKEQANNEDRYIQKQIFEVNNLQCFLVTNNILRENYFLISSSNKLLNIFKDRALLSKGVRIFNIDKGEKGELLIHLLDQELKDVFILFIQNIVNATAGLATEEDVIREIYSVIRRWKKLFEKFGHNLLSEEQEKGLIGELFFIYSALEKKIKERDIIESWDGPSLNDKDFLFRTGKAVEIKLTEAKNPVLKITSERQLDSTNYQSLFIVLFAVEPNNNGSLSLVKLINAIRNKLESPEIRSNFNEKLATIGYQDQDAEQYKLTYYIKNTFYFDATSDRFPKIVSNQLTAGIFNVSYSIDLVVLNNYMIQSEDFFNYITHGKSY